MTASDYTAFVAMDWGDEQHAIALQLPGQGIEQLEVPATAEALHGWLDQLGLRCGHQPVALAIEAGRNAVVHALVSHGNLRFAAHQHQDAHRGASTTGRARGS